MKKYQNIIILHGWNSSPQKWEKVKKELVGLGCKVYIPFLPGFSKQELQKPLTVDDYAKWLFLYLKDNKVGRAIFVGHSNGGRIAARFSASNPSMVEQLVLVGAAGVQAKKSVKKNIFSTLAYSGKAILRNTPIFPIARRALYMMLGEFDYYNASPLMKKTMQNMLAYNIDDDIKRSKIPLSLIWGKTDKETPLWMGKRIHALSPQSQLYTLDGGHNMHVEQPEKLARIINKTIKK